PTPLPIARARFRGPPTGRARRLRAGSSRVASFLLRQVFRAGVALRQAVFPAAPESPETIPPSTAGPTPTPLIAALRIVRDLFPSPPLPFCLPLLLRLKAVGSFAS